MSEEAVVLVTCPADQAERIATVLVEARLAACVNILPGAVSVYEWEGKLCKDAETMLVIKSSSRIYGALEAKILQVHPYEVPEIILLPISTGSKSYLDWINCQVGRLKNSIDTEPLKYSELSTNLENSADSKNLTYSENSTNSENPTNSKNSTNSENPTNSKNSTNSENPTNSKNSTNSKNFTDSDKCTNSEITTSSEASNRSVSSGRTRKET